MQFTVRHVFDTDVDSYWSKIFFDDEYNRRLYRDALGFPMYEIVKKDVADNGNIVRRARMEPKADAPAVVKKLVGDSLTYTEDGSFDAAKKRWSYTIATSKLSDKIKIGGEFWVEPRGEKQVERICTVDVNVKIFGVGGVVEAFLESSTRDSYEKAARFTREFIREKKL